MHVRLRDVQTLTKRDWIETQSPPSIMAARFRRGTRRLRLLSHGQVIIRRPQREQDTWYRVHRSRLSNCHAYVKIERAGLCGCGRKVQRPRPISEGETPPSWLPFPSVLLLEKGVREREAHLPCIDSSPNNQRRSLYALGVRLGRVASPRQIC